ncbi:MAG: DUF222 domain-containing protein [Woeseiaceae bacterium]|nr:DUF222 domain-containing protein [Woeseiaceae bacterium]
MATTDTGPTAVSDSVTASEAESLGDEIATLCSVLYAAEARLLAHIHRFDAAGCCEKLGFPSTAHWLNYRCGIGMNAAREKVRVANALPELPKIREAFAKGRLSYSKVRAMTRVATPQNEDNLLSVATYGTAHHVEKLVSLTRRAQRLQDDATAEAAYQARELSVRYDETGAMILNGRFPAEQGALIVKALELAMEIDFREGRENSDVDAAKGEDAEASRDVTAVTSERVPVAARRADALTAVAESFLNHPGNAGSTADRYQVVVHVTAPIPSSSLDAVGVASPPRLSDVAAVTPRLDDGPGVTAETSRRLACDCSILPVAENAFGEPLSIGRKSRSIPPAIRRALQLRDGGCRFPGCTRTRLVDGHHIRHWADGGETSLGNLVLLCRMHHRLVHEGGCRVERRAGGEIVFRDGHDRPISDAALLPGFGADLDAWINRQIFESDIDHDACRAKMDGTDRMDWDMAVEGVM